jgi:hypothetical protein
LTRAAELQKQHARQIEGLVYKLGAERQVSQGQRNRADKLEKANTYLINKNMTAYDNHIELVARHHKELTKGRKLWQAKMQEAHKMIRECRPAQILQSKLTAMQQKLDSLKNFRELG